MEGDLTKDTPMSVLNAHSSQGPHVAREAPVLARQAMCSPSQRQGVEAADGAAKWSFLNTLPHL